MGEKVEVKARVTGEGPELGLVTTDLPDGSRIVPEPEYKKVLQTMCLRDRQLHKAGLTEAQIEEEVRKLIDVYDKAKVGEKIEWAALGRTLIK